MKHLAPAVAFILAVCGCGQLPRDPNHTLLQVRETKTLRVGIINLPPWAECESGQATGTEAQIVSDFAEELGADPEWRCVAEAEGVAALKAGELDLVAGGLLQDSPWRDETAFTRPYKTSSGSGDKHVMAVKRGENRFLTTLEVFLAGIAPDAVETIAPDDR